MKNKIIIIMLTICILTGTIHPKKAQATGVEIAIVIGVEVVNYLVLASIASGVAVEDIYEKKNENDGNWISVTNKNGNQFELASGAMYKLSQGYAKSLVDSLSKTQLKELSSAITIDNNTMKVSNVGEDTYNSINSMNEMIRNNPKLKSYLNSDTLTGKTMNQIQLELLKTAFTSIKAYNSDLNVLELSKTYPYYVIFPTSGDYGGTSINENQREYAMAFSEYPIFTTCRQENLTGDYKQLFYEVFTYNGEKLGNVNSYCWFNSNNYGGRTIKSSEMTNNPFKFWQSGISVVGNGLMVVGNADYIRLSDLSFPNHTSLNWERYVNEVASRYYSLPISCLNSMTIDTYMPYPKDGVRVKEDEKVVIPPITSLDNIDDLAEYVNVGSVADLTNGRTIDNTDSALRSGLIDKVIDWDKTDIPGTGDTTIDLTQTNERLDKILEKLGQLVGSVEGIDALTDSQLRDILDELELEGANALTVDQVRELMNERDKAQGVELELELDLKKYEVDSGIINKFPFCIPFDLVRVIKKMDSTATAPRFEFPFKFQRLGINETIVLDLSQFEKVAVVVRWFVLVSYLLLLIYTTRSLIKG